MEVGGGVYMCLQYPEKPEEGVRGQKREMDPSG